RDLVLVVHKEKCLVLPVIQVRYSQRPAQAPARALVVVRNVRSLGSGDRIRPGIQRRILVAIKKAEANPVDRLARQSASPSSLSAATARPSGKSGATAAAEPATSTPKSPPPSTPPHPPPKTPPPPRRAPRFLHPALLDLPGQNRRAPPRRRPARRTP